MNEYEKEFNEEVRRKKKAANGVHSRTGRNGFTGTIRTPADLLKGKERRAYEGTSEVSVSYSDEAIIDLAEFKKMPRGKKMTLLHNYRQRFSQRQISDRWGITPATVSYYFKQYLASADGLSEEKKPSRKKSEDSDKSRKKANPGPQQEPSPKKTKRAKGSVAERAEAESPSTRAAHDESAAASECLYKMTGRFTGRDVSRKLQGLSYLMVEDKQYQIEVSIKELS